MSIKKGYILPHPPIIWCSNDPEDMLKLENTITSYKDVAKEIEDSKGIDTIVLITPHGPIFADGICVFSEDYLSGDLLEFSKNNTNTEITVKNDLEFVDTLISLSEENNIPLVKNDKELQKRFNIKEKLDHGSIVPLLFLKAILNRFKVIIISYGLLSSEKLYNFGMLIEETSEKLNRNSIIIASGDLSHKVSSESPYGYNKNGPIFDNTFIEYFKNDDVEKLLYFDKEIIEEASECGKKSFDIMIGTFDKSEISCKALSYEAPFGIGYFIGSINILKKNKFGKYAELLETHKKNTEARLEREDEYVSLARKSIKEFLLFGKVLEVPNDISAELINTRGGVFVSLKNSGGLRGCIGTTGGIEKNIASEIIRNAIKAATEDPRFNELEIYELEDLEITVDVLGKNEKVESINELDPKIYGIIVESDYKSGLLLPNLKGIDTVYDQIKIALNKGGIDKNEDYEIKKFTVTRHY